MMIGNHFNEHLLDLSNGKFPALDAKTSKALLEKLANVNIKPEDTDFIQQAMLGYAEQILEFCNVDFQDAQTGDTALINAALKGNVALVKLLLNNHANVHLKNTNKQNALHAAASGGSHEIVELLLEKGSHYLEKSKEGALPLHLAIHYPPILKLLLEKGTPINAQCDKGNTVLHNATQFAAPVETIKLLLAYGANMTIENSHHQTCLDIATRRGRAIPEHIRLIKEENTILVRHCKEHANQAKFTFLLGMYDRDCNYNQPNIQILPEIAQLICSKIDYRDFIDVEIENRKMRKR